MTWDGFAGSRSRSSPRNRRCGCCSGIRRAGPSWIPSHPDHEHARAIARMLGRLPLALELAGAYLGKFSGDVSLAGYREGLRSDGAPGDARRRRRGVDRGRPAAGSRPGGGGHDPRAMGRARGTSRRDWCCGSRACSRSRPRCRSRGWACWPGSRTRRRPGRLSPLLRAVKRLDAACLVERLEGDQVRLHPLIREFAAGQTTSRADRGLPPRVPERAAAALEQFPTLEALDGRRGVEGLQEDLIAILEICPLSASESEFSTPGLLRLLQREAHNLRVGVSRISSRRCSPSRSRTARSCWESLPSIRRRRAADCTGSAAFPADLDGEPGITRLDPDTTGHVDRVKAVAVSTRLPPRLLAHPKAG